jgi:hypothetical protein
VCKNLRYLNCLFPWKLKIFDRTLPRPGNNDNFICFQIIFFTCSPTRKRYSITYRVVVVFVVVMSMRTSHGWTGSGGHLSGGSDGGRGGNTAKSEHSFCMCVGKRTRLICTLARQFVVCINTKKPNSERE